MLCSKNVWLVPVVTLVGFGPSAAPAIAQTTYTFSANYDLLNNGTSIAPGLSEIFVSGTSTDAPYGLAQINSLIYSQSDFVTGELRTDTDPTALDLQGLPLGYVVLEGTGSDKLFGTETANGAVDLQTLGVTNNGTITLTGGEGIFSEATGTLSFSEVGSLIPDPSVPYYEDLSNGGTSIASVLRVERSVNGSFEAVPEPGTDTGMLVGMGIIGAGVLLRRRSRRATQEYIAVVNQSTK